MNSHSPHRSASVHFACPKCGRTYIVPVSEPPSGTPRPHFDCEACGFSIKFEQDCPASRTQIDRCALCGNRDFYTQKDFNRQLGLFLVLVSGIIALLVMVYNHILGLGVLAVVTLVDAAIFKFIRQVTVCYLCHTIYRGYPNNSDHKPFYLGNEERFKKLREDWLEGMKNEE